MIKEKHRKPRALVVSALCIFFLVSNRPTHSGTPEEPQNSTTRKVAEGVTYSHRSYPKQRWSVHTVSIDLSKGNLGVRMGKALDHISGLERVQSILHRFDSTNANYKALAGINANFWFAGSRYPIGPTVIDGIVLNAEKHRNWSSVAFTEDRKAYIDNFSLSAEIRTRYGILSIDRINSRYDSLSRVIYTPFFGNTVPFLDTAIIILASRDTITDESEFENITSVIDSALTTSRESGSLKVQFEFARSPAANTIVPCRIISIDTGIVSIPRNGGVLSFGKGPFPLFFSLFVGDTFSLSTRLSPAVPARVQFMASGTPRLVRNGQISVEWQEEGLRKVRFVNNRYARSAFGLSRDGKKMILMTVEATSRRKGRSGIKLTDLARLLMEEGAYEAVNFDGGSSATMVVDDDTVSPSAGTGFSRKISTTLFVVRKK